MILLVSELYYPEEISTGFILTKIAEGLAENTSVQVITGPPDYSGLKIAPQFEVRNNVKIERVKAISLNKNKIVSLEKTTKIANLQSQIDEKRILAICEPTVKDEATGQTWLEYYNLQVQDLRNQIVALG